MARLVYSRQALADIDEITAFSVAEFGVKTAAQYLDGLELVCEYLSEFPKTSPIYPRLRPEMRCRVFRSHRIFYHVDNDAVTIVRVLHHARDTKGAFK